MGELLLTAGVLVLLFIAWQMWIGDLIIGAENNAKGAALSAQWADEEVPAPPLAEDEDGGTVQTLPVLSHPADAEIFANMRIPRFGDDYNVNIAGGTSRERTLDRIGIGLYTQSKMPGEMGNLSLAGHRTTWGKPFNRIDELRLGDAIVVETREGWFTYRFRNLQYVKPSAGDVLLDVPQMPETPAGDRLITLTACSPLYSLAERIVAYGVFESFQPRAEGPPPALTDPPPPPAAPSVIPVVSVANVVPPV